MSCGFCNVLLFECFGVVCIFDYWELLLSDFFLECFDVVIDVVGGMLLWEL